MASDRLEIRYHAQARAAIRPIRLNVPGWAGESRERGDGAVPQPWHCVPFVEASTYGFELVWAASDELRIANHNGKVAFSASPQDLQDRFAHVVGEHSQFTPGHYGLNSNLDIRVPDGYVLRIEPHPSFYTDSTGTVPCAIAGHIQTAWWPNFFFVVIKIPPPGGEHIYRPGQPYAQALVVPHRPNYELREMTQGEVAERARQSRDIAARKESIAKQVWTSRDGVVFTDVYRTLARGYNDGGLQRVNELIYGATPAQERGVFKQDPSGGGGLGSSQFKI
jgi:hypothetical protein